MDETLDEFCCLCWKSTRGVYPSKTKNELFCSDHLCAGETKKNNYRDKRRITRGLEQKDIEVPEKLTGTRLYRLLSTNLTKLSLDPKTLIESGPFFEKLSLMSPKFKQMVSTKLPITFKKVKVCFEQKLGADELMLAMFSQISQPRRKEMQNPITPQKSSPTNHLLTPATFISMLARYEAYESLNEKVVKRGPKPKQHRDETLRNKIIHLYNAFTSVGDYRCQTRIAEQLSITPARVSVLMKELIAEKKLTKRMTKAK